MTVLYVFFLLPPVSYHLVSMHPSTKGFLPAIGKYLIGLQETWRLDGWGPLPHLKPLPNLMGIAMDALA